MRCLDKNIKDENFSFWNKLSNFQIWDSAFVYSAHTKADSHLLLTLRLELLSTGRKLGLGYPLVLYRVIAADYKLILLSTPTSPSSSPFLLSIKYANNQRWFPARDSQGRNFHRTVHNFHDSDCLLVPRYVWPYSPLFSAGTAEEFETIYNTLWREQFRREVCVETETYIFLVFRNGFTVGRTIILPAFGFVQHSR